MTPAQSAVVASLKKALAKAKSDASVGTVGGWLEQLAGTAESATQVRNALAQYETRIRELESNATRWSASTWQSVAESIRDGIAYTAGVAVDGSAFTLLRNTVVATASDVKDGAVAVAKALPNPTLVVVVVGLVAAAVVAFYVVPLVKK